MRLWLDLETYSETPIAYGTHAYAANAEIMIFAWAVDDEPAQAMDMTDPSADPNKLIELMNGAGELWAHNSSFDRTVLRHVWGFNRPVEDWRDTMAQAFSHGMPGNLGKLCEVLRVPTDKAKDKDGRRLIQTFCKPRPKSSKIRRATRETHPADWQRFVDYAVLDIEAMREVHKRLPTWNYKGAELDLWHMDQRINDRGVAIDMDLVRGALAAVDEAQAELAKRTVEMTEEKLASTTQGEATKLYIAERFGVVMDNLQMATVERVVDDSDTDPALRALLLVRLQASTSSTAKYKTLDRAVSGDCRLRGILQFNGAARTGRWCLAEGSLVTVKQPDDRIRQVPIQEVCAEDLVWDGTQWVAHEGVVFSGVKEVIRHDGITATAQHIVYLSSSDSVTLLEAKEKNLPIWKGESCSISTD